MAQNFASFTTTERMTNPNVLEMLSSALATINPGFARPGDFTINPGLINPGIGVSPGDFTVAPGVFEPGGGGIVGAHRARHPDRPAARASRRRHHRRPDQHGPADAGDAGRRAGRPGIHVRAGCGGAASGQSGAGYPHPAGSGHRFRCRTAASILDGQSLLAGQPTRGINLVILDAELNLKYRRAYDTFAFSARGRAAGLRSAAAHRAERHRHRHDLGRVLVAAHQQRARCAGIGRRRGAGAGQPGQRRGRLHRRCAQQPDPRQLQLPDLGAAGRSTRHRRCTADGPALRLGLLQPDAAALPAGRVVGQHGGRGRRRRPAAAGRQAAAASSCRWIRASVCRCRARFSAASRCRSSVASATGAPTRCATRA